MQLISDIKDYERCLAEVKRFLPYINNWATCDIPRPKCFAKHKTELLPVIKEWIASGNTYTIRYGIGTLMSFYLDEDFKPEYIELVASVQSEEYYVNMMIACRSCNGTGKTVGCNDPISGRTKVITVGA